MCTKISLLIPVYGVENYIERCARSLFGQTYQNIEYIFVDDCTKDSSIDVLKSVLNDYPFRKKQVAVIHHNSNKGLSAARNTAFSHATGDYIIHVDSDDYLELDAVRLLCEFAETECADVVVFDNYCVYGNRIVENHQHIPNDKTSYIKNLIERKDQSSIWGKMFLRKLVLDSGVQSFENVNFGEDYAVVPRLMYYAKKIVKLDKYLYYYVQYNKESYTNNITLKSINELYVANNMLEHFFSGQKDYYLYNNSISLSKLRIQVYLLKVSNKTLWNYIEQLNAEPIHEYSYLPLFDKILLKLLKNERYRTLSFIVYAYRQMIKLK
ncbi:glycosyltransferase family 2 protein [Phocaeicola sp.]